MMLCESVWGYCSYLMTDCVIDILRSAEKASGFQTILSKTVLVAVQPFPEC